MQTTTKTKIEGILPVIKPAGKNSFFLVSVLRRLTGVSKIGHAGTLDPFAEGVMVLLIGQKYTRLSNQFLTADKEYRAKLLLGKATDTFDLDGTITNTSEKIPSRAEIDSVLAQFQGTIAQIPPMYSAKKKDGKKLYELARKGIEIEREAVPVDVKTIFLSYSYPYLELSFHVSKGTYIRSLADEIGKQLGCYAHLEQLIRTRSGNFSLSHCVTLPELLSPDFSFSEALLS